MIFVAGAGYRLPLEPSGFRRMGCRISRVWGQKMTSLALVVSTHHVPSFDFLGGSSDLCTPYNSCLGTVRVTPTASSLSQLNFQWQEVNVIHSPHLQFPLLPSHDH
jgi:hypothetical protein